jgi:hypothetical protein
MGEGLSASEVGKELAEHSRHAAKSVEGSSHDRVVSIVEALLLAIVAVLAAWSGFSSAKWSTESRLELAQASTARTEANRARLEADATKNFDASTFNTWFTAYVVGNQSAMNVAEKRFRPEFKVAFDAWIATDPATNPAAAPGPTYMPQYKEPDAVKAQALDARADRLYARGAEAGGYADDYVRTTVYLATVLFLVGISGHFRFRAARIGLITVGSAILIYAIILLALAPKPPT